MFLIVGQKATRKELGWAADFCPICRGLSPLHVTQIRHVTHLYYIPLGRGKVQGYEKRCGGCGMKNVVDQVRYQAYQPSAGLDLVDLALLTTPDIAETCGPRMDLEDRLAAGLLSPAERAELIAEPFVVVAHMAQGVGKSGHIPTGAGVAIIALVFTVPATIVVWLQPAVPLAFKAILAGFIAILLLAMRMSWKRGGTNWVRRHLHPYLVRALLPLEPTRDELVAALTLLQSRKESIAHKINAEWLLTDLESAAAAAPAHNAPA